MIYFGCFLNETLSEKSMALKVINEINSRLRFLYRKNRFLYPLLCRLLCNSHCFVQSHFDYARSAWYNDLKLYNKCIRFCLNLNNGVHIGRNEFEQIKWLPVNDRFEQIISLMSLKFCNNTSPRCMKYIFKGAGQPNTTTRAFLLKLN